MFNNIIHVKNDLINIAKFETLDESKFDWSVIFTILDHTNS